MNTLKSALAVLALTLSGLFAALPASAAGTVLTLQGLPGHAQPVTLDLAELEKMPAGKFTTTTTWTTGPQDFTGIYLADLLAHYGVKSGDVKLVAVNDYSVTVPASELRPNEALLAYERNGKPMSVRDKGPLWVVYPYDSDPSLQNEVVYARSVWQVVKIEILP